MRILLFILLFSFNTSAQVVGFMPVYSAPIPSYPTTVDGVIEDDGYYNAFPMGDTLLNGNLFSIHKKSYDHASAGYLMLNQTSDGGVTNYEFPIIVGTDTVISAAHSLGIIRSINRILIAYQDDETYSYIKFAYSDDNGVTFTQSDSIYFGAVSSPSPVKMMVMPSGKIRMGYYRVNIPSDSSIVGFVNSTDNGLSWAIGESIFEHGGTGYGDNNGNEFAFVVTDSTGSDATTKMAAFIRNSDAAYYMHYFSDDGGATWNTSFTEDAGAGGPYSRHYLYNFGSASNQAPVDAIRHNDSIYIVTGYRNTAPSSDGYWLEYLSTSSSNAYINNWNNYADTVRLRLYNAFTLGSDIDCGYPVLFHNRLGQLWIRDYDISTQPLNPAIAADRCWIYQFKIAD